MTAPGSCTGAARPPFVSPASRRNRSSDRSCRSRSPPDDIRRRGACSRAPRPPRARGCRGQALTRGTRRRTPPGTSWQPASPSTFEAKLQPVLAELRVVERAEPRRGDVRLDVGGKERVERVVRAYPDPRLQLADLEAVLEPEIESEVVRHPQRVPRADEIEHLVDSRVRQSGAPV